MYDKKKLNALKIPSKIGKRLPCKRPWPPCRSGRINLSLLLLNRSTGFTPRWMLKTWIIKKTSVCRVNIRIYAAFTRPPSRQVVDDAHVCRVSDGRGNQ